MRKVTRSQIPKGIVGLRDNCVAKIKYRCSKDDFKHNVYVCVCVSVCVCVCSVTQLCPTLCDPTDCSLQVSSVPGILQARTLEWVAISPSRASSLTRRGACLLHLLHWRVDSLPLRQLRIVRTKMYTFG